MPLSNEQKALLHLLNCKSLLSSSHVKSLAKEFTIWCWSHDEYNPRKVTLVVFLETNYPEHDSEYNKLIHNDVDAIWEQTFRT